jgi:hypothetical protein
VRLSNSPASGELGLREPVPAALVVPESHAAPARLLHQTQNVRAVPFTPLLGHAFDSRKLLRAQDRGLDMTVACNQQAPHLSVFGSLLDNVFYQQVSQHAVAWEVAQARLPHPVGLKHVLKIHRSSKTGRHR